MSSAGKYSMKHTMWFFAFVLFFATAQGSLAQSTEAATDPCKTVPSDFRDMADFKGSITNEIAMLEQTVKDLPAKKRSIQAS